MSQCFRKFFADSDRPFLDLNIKLLKYGGLFFSKNIKMKYLYLFMHYFVMLFVMTEILEIWYERANLDVVLRNLKYSMLSVVNCVKVYTYIHWQNDWLHIINFVTTKDKERRGRNHKEINNIINKYTPYGRFVTFTYLILISLTAILVCLQPLLLYISPDFRSDVRNGTIRRPEIVSAWTPYNKMTTVGYILTMCIQAFSAFVAGIWIVMFDTTAIATIIFLEAELRMIRIDARYIFGSKIDPATLVESKERIRSCHKTHLDLTSLFNFFMSPIMLLYTVVCSVMLCVTAYQIQVETSAFQKIMSAQYLMFGILQLFMYCWHSSLMLYSSTDLMRGPYESRWWTCPAHRQKDLLLLVHQFRKPLAVQAGPIAYLTFLAFISILKGAYSYYTLLRKV